MVKYLITGASGSLGKTLVEKIYNKDDFFYLFYNKKKPSYIKKNKNIIFCKFNFKNTHKIKSFLSKKFRSKLTNIDVLINCAGSASPHKKLNTLDYDEISEIYKINLFTPLLMFNFFINKHKKQKNKVMKIVNISTTSKGSLNSSHYSHSKKSLNFYCYKLAENFSIDGVLINTVSPGFLDNDMHKNVKFYNKKNFNRINIPNFLKKRGKNEDIVNVISFLLNSENNYINGAVYEVDGGS
jgi:3-oxoacyl-[acyl-carrier protein] reductase